MEAAQSPSALQRAQLGLPVGREVVGRVVARGEQEGYVASYQAGGPYHWTVVWVSGSGETRGEVATAEELAEWLTP